MCHLASDEVGPFLVNNFFPIIFLKKYCFLFVKGNKILDLLGYARHTHEWWISLSTICKEVRVLLRLYQVAHKGHVKDT